MMNSTQPKPGSLKGLLGRGDSSNSNELKNKKASLFLSSTLSQINMPSVTSSNVN